MLNYKEFVKLNDGYVYLSHTEIPDGIKSWVKNFSGSYVKDFKIDQSGDKVCIKMPWHERCVETYQFFNLTGNNAVPVGNSVTRKGYEGDSYQDFLEGQTKEGCVEIPMGKVLESDNKFLPSFVIDLFFASKPLLINLS